MLEQMRLALIGIQHGHASQGRRIKPPPDTSPQGGIH
jgi:hypothetical protein